jgi:hypothetical protein
MRRLPPALFNVLIFCIWASCDEVLCGQVFYVRVSEGRCVLTRPARHRPGSLPKSGLWCRAAVLPAARKASDLTHCLRVVHISTWLCMWRSCTAGKRVFSECATRDASGALCMAWMVPAAQVQCTVEDVMRQNPRADEAAPTKAVEKVSVARVLCTVNLVSAELTTT